MPYELYMTDEARAKLRELRQIFRAADWRKLCAGLARAAICAAAVLMVWTAATAQAAGLGTVTYHEDGDTDPISKYCVYDDATDKLHCTATHITSSDGFSMGMCFTNNGSDWFIFTTDTPADTFDTSGSGSAPNRILDMSQKTVGHYYDAWIHTFDDDFFEPNASAQFKSCVSVSGGLPGTPGDPCVFGSGAGKFDYCDTAGYITGDVVGTYCGNSVCETGEDFLSCPSDCDVPVPELVWLNTEDGQDVTLIDDINGSLPTGGWLGGLVVAGFDTDVSTVPVLFNVEVYDDSGGSPDNLICSMATWNEAWPADGDHYGDYHYQTPNIFAHAETGPCDQFVVGEYHARASEYVDGYGTSAWSAYTQFDVIDNFDPTLPYPDSVAAWVAVPEDGSEIEADDLNSYAVPYDIIGVSTVDSSAYPSLSYSTWWQLFDYDDSSAVPVCEWSEWTGDDEPFTWSNLYAHKWWPAIGECLDDTGSSLDFSFRASSVAGYGVKTRFYFDADTTTAWSPVVTFNITDTEISDCPDEPSWFSRCWWERLFKWLVWDDSGPIQGFAGFLESPIQTTLDRIKTRWPLAYIFDVGGTIVTSLTADAPCPLPDISESEIYGMSVPSTDACDISDDVRSAMDADAGLQTWGSLVIWVLASVAVIAIAASIFRV